MKKILIRPVDIKKCWETHDACIIEEYNGRIWVCKKFFIADDYNEWNSLTYIKKNKDQEFLTIELIEKGKSDRNG